MPHFKQTWTTLITAGDLISTVILFSHSNCLPLNQSLFIINCVPEIRSEFVIQRWAPVMMKWCSDLCVLMGVCILCVLLCYLSFFLAFLLSFVPFLQIDVFAVVSAVAYIRTCVLILFECQLLLFSQKLMFWCLRLINDKLWDCVAACCLSPHLTYGFGYETVKT